MSQSLMRVVVWFFLGLLTTTGTLRAEAWVTLEDCRLVRSDGNDADSFLVRHQGREYIFRLYFVDAPETSMMIPSRVREQAEVFGVSEERVLAAGEEATRFALRHLARPFTVRTKWQDARGRSAMPRHFAFVETADGQDLGELLAAAGYVRSFGAPAAPPGRNEQQLRQRYDRLAERAKRAQLGAWSERGNVGSVDLDGDEEEIVGSTDPDEPPPGGLMAQVLGSTSLAFDTDDDPAPRPTPTASASSEMSEPKLPSGVTADGKVDLNHASKEELQTLPGIDAAIAASIVAARPLAGPHELLRIPGVTPSTLKEVFPLLAD